MNLPDKKFPSSKPKEFEILITNDSQENVTFYHADSRTWHHIRPGRFYRYYSHFMQAPEMRSTGPVEARKTETERVMILEIY